jgi:membrane protein
MTSPRVPAPARSLLARYAHSWAGRVVEQGLRALVNVEVFDRSMTLAAQAFTSVFPLLILIATLRPRRSGNPVGSGLADSLGLNQHTREALESAVPSSGSAASTFGVIGVLVVVLSATSFSRALVRMYARVWDTPSPPGLRSLWRWIAALLGVVVLVFFLTFVRRVLSDEPFSSIVEAVAALVLGGLLWTWAPWMLLARRVPVRMLIPGGALMAVAMMVLALAGHVYLPLALSSATRQFGVLGISFTYVSWLFVLMFALVVTTVIGAVVAKDPGPFQAVVRPGTVPSRTA